MRSSCSTPTTPWRPANTLPIFALLRRQVSMTPQADALITAVTPPDCAYSAFLGLDFGIGSRPEWLLWLRRIAQRAPHRRPPSATAGEGLMFTPPGRRASSRWRRGARQERRQRGQYPASLLFCRVAPRFSGGRNENDADRVARGARVWEGDAGAAPAGQVRRAPGVFGRSTARRRGARHAAWPEGQEGDGRRSAGLR